MTPEEIKATIKDVVAAYATDNHARAEEGLQQVLKSKMRELVQGAQASVEAAPASTDDTLPTE